MPDLLLDLLFMAVPASAGLLGSVLVASAYSDLRSRPDEAVTVSMARARLPVLFALFALPFVFGADLWFLLGGVERDNGALQGEGYAVALWMGASFSTVVVLAVASQCWLGRARLRAFLSANFGRILNVMVVPDTSLVFFIVLFFLALGRLSSLLANPTAFSLDAANRLILVFQVYAFASFSIPLGIGLSLRVEDLATARGFVRMVARADLSALVATAALVWGFLQLGSL